MKRKFWKSSIPAALLLCLALVLTACGGGSSNPPAETTAAPAETTAAPAETPAETQETATPAETTAAPETEPETEANPVGTYTAQVDMKDFVNKGMAEAGLAFESDITANLDLDLKEDGSFFLAMDVDSLIESMSAALKKEGPKLFRDTFIAQGITEDQFESLAQQAGYDNFDAMVDDMLVELDAQLAEGFTDLEDMDASSEGTYTIEGDKLTLSNGEGGHFEADGTLLLTTDMGSGQMLDIPFKKK